MGLLFTDKARYSIENEYLRCLKNSIRYLIAGGKIVNQINKLTSASCTRQQKNGSLLVCALLCMNYISLGILLSLNWLASYGKL